MSTRDKITLATLRSMKLDRKPISMLTAYDYPTAQIEEAAGVECILVGDSAAQVILGHNSTLPITVDFLVTLAGAVRRGAPMAYLVGDMPYMSYHVNHEEAIRNAGRFMAEAGCDCVKVEGDGRLAPTIEKMTAATIPVMAHLGLRPQAVHQIGGYRAQGRDADAAERLVEDAKKLEAAGACALLLEAVAPEPARRIAESTDLPVIGCGAGPYCDGHVLVLHDMAGLADGPPARFVKQYGDIRSAIRAAVDGYIEDVRSRKYPSEEHFYKMRAGQAAILADRAAGI
ncbi:MAG TPA: 3-methyl-2-oxobutanoate hydroxymethyltransferase [Phycisphaerae bacterium]|nr:3-methyl-2-oxobutanoate hydroxymethyltransferase [Phycisphaerae bacterium]HRW54220.1 3-methyl-2-oxobutanoate hydroxymethyltransferase [Phycisphaerae bacterium]